MNDSRNDNDAKKENVIPDHVSPLRYILHEAGQDRLISIRNLKEASETKNAVMIMEGDWGGQIYLTSPIKHVKCDERCLIQLLQDLDELAWGDQGKESRKVVFEVRNIGDQISGGMGGGSITDEIWIHEEFKEERDLIKEVIKGRRERMNTDT
ncbi:hypothetical protein PZB74_18710 [Porifericola rhodea]|uniref:hypothetical protein n=1 Tax=Porifericola rhodea TaxID=930972 RepID=UPI002665D840|nr:hypothetical protein [Porifericola rhodea]WKN30987.1 hypothetical protein PZB74_18710 [Porifericola rhodea]